MPPFAHTGLTFCATFACIALGLYWMPDEGRRAALQWLSIGIAVLLGLAVIAAVATAWRQRRAAYREARAIRALAKRHPDTTITPLSNGRFLLTDLASGRALGDVDANGR